ncbi:accessory Sec system glycosylation chaperone GtfB [Streptococcus pluranimalium]|uniref:UDP-N-acetylglucosamine--peptide N-acetylglucosaminyltransferase stabilizing protein GtfB n=1 Tax=Streptococcus pluranimalium TaxID=82348 RepID=A0A345VMR3_9STRE|nr:accessory Sec system glycosylation chaperone GtfB [Streptococcus pluranimalium]AXJ14015.1 Glycosyltransferase-stabilizing protein Gtf2 [Streptococcus pluranimalium]
MIQLYDDYHQGSRDLHYSLSKAGYDGPVVVNNDDGFLPEGVTSVYAYFCEMSIGEGKPLYFNQLSVPELWEITGNNSEGAVWDYGTLKAKIFYAEPKHLRYIKNVDWYDDNQKVRFTDHYNQSGWLFARTSFTSEQKLATKSYFNRLGYEVIVENFLTGDIILNWEGKVQFFENRVALLTYYFKIMAWDCDQIWYNSLSTPFFLSYHSKEQGEDILFWQEEIGEELPGNMRVMLNSETVRTQRVIVQNRQTYDKMMEIATPEQQSKLSYLGFIYPQLRDNNNRKDILIVTNSDRIERLEFLVNELTDYTFHIAALTEMSPRLSALESEPNIRLYPNISQKTLDRLFSECDVYFDINHGSEVLNAVRRAFENRMLIFAFENTVHQVKLIAPEHLVSSEKVESIIHQLRQFEGQFEVLATIQERETVQESKETYRSYLGSEGTKNE